MLVVSRTSLRPGLTEYKLTKLQVCVSLDAITERADGKQMVDHASLTRGLDQPFYHIVRSSPPLTP